jgi:mannose-6-phosphate isomerase
MTQLYPLKFKTIFKEKLWGGDKIKTILNKDFSPLANCGETWEISGVEGDVSVVSNGELKGKNLNEILASYKADLVGKFVLNEYPDEFPLLVKFIDAAKDLSIQVHPNDELAEQRHGCKGKSEMWYIFQADEDSSLISGFNQNLTKTSYLEQLNNGGLEAILNREPIVSGDVFYLPAGRVHTIGKGLLLAEIQQTSDVTYRIYDFDRIDKNGQQRELHTDLALDALDFTKQEEYKTSYIDKVNNVVELAKTPYFSTNKLWFNRTTVRDYSNLDCFVIYLCFEGEFNIKCSNGTINVKKGEAILLPATMSQVELEVIEEFQLLESYIEAD